jgi:glycosyltransferase involved in cell wall biosynthesis
MADESALPSRQKHILIVTPVFNDWASLAQLTRDLSEVARKNQFRLTLFAVDDGSSELPGPLASDDVLKIQIVHLVRNLGHQRAIAVGLVEAYRQFESQRYDALVVMDSDGEDPPGDVPSLLKALQQAPEGIAVATRRRRHATFAFRAGYWIYKQLYRALCSRTVDFGNFCAISPAALQQLVHAPEIWNHLAATVSRQRCRIVRVPHDRAPRYAGQPKMTLQPLVLLGMSALSVYIDVILIRLIFATLVFAAATGAVILALLFLYFFTDLPVRGWTSILAGVLLAILLQVLLASVGASFVLLNNRSSIARVPLLELPVFVRERREL